MSILRVSRRRAFELAAAGVTAFSLTDAAFAQAPTPSPHFSHKIGASGPRIGESSSATKR